LQRVRDAAEKAKIELSSTQETDINQPYITQGKSGQPLHLSLKLSRAKLEQLVSDLVESTLKPVEDCLKDAKIKTSEVKEIIMVGRFMHKNNVLNLIKAFKDVKDHSYKLILIVF